MKPIPLLLFAAIFTMCNHAKQETSITDSVAVEQKDTTVTEQPTTEEPSSSPVLESKSFEEIPQTYKNL